MSAGGLVAAARAASVAEWAASVAVEVGSGHTIDTHTIDGGKVMGRVRSVDEGVMVRSHVDQHCAVGWRFSMRNSQRIRISLKTNRLSFPRSYVRDSKMLAGTEPSEGGNTAHSMLSRTPGTRARH